MTPYIAKAAYWPPLLLQSQRSQPFQAGLLAPLHPFGKPGGGEVAGYLGALQGDARQHGAGLPLAGLLVGQGKDPVVEIALGKIAGVAELQALVNGLLAHAEAAGDGMNSEFCLARQI